jgi:hypothetical protein
MSSFLQWKVFGILGFMLISWGEEKGRSGFDVGGCQQKKKDGIVH